MNKHLHNKLKKVKLLVLDVDGILTNGEIVVDSNGKELKIYNVQDGFGLVLLRRMGFKIAIITARSGKAVEARAKDLSFDKVYLNAYPKIEAYNKLIKELKLKDSEVCFMGDDLPDLQVLKRVGVPITVPNAVAEIKKIAQYITSKEGGCGAVRETVEMILKAKGLWPEVMKRYE